ncbi:hypothetical protein D3C80_1422110 [compost metagenome]
MSPLISAPKQHSGPQACQPSITWLAPAPEMIEASTIVTYSLLPLRGSWPAMLMPLVCPQEAVTRCGEACSSAVRTASAKVSIGVVVQLTWGAGSSALHKVPLGPTSTVTQRYRPSL